MDFLFFSSIFSTFATYFGVLLLETNMSTIAMSSWWINPFIITKLHTISSNTFVLRYTLFDINIATLGFLWLMLPWYIFFPSFYLWLTFLLFNLKWTSDRQHIVWSWFCFVSCNTMLLFLFIGLFNKSTFNDIIYMVGFISLILLFIFYRSQFFVCLYSSFIVFFVLGGYFLV